MQETSSASAPDEWEAIERIKEIVNRDALPLRSSLLPIGDDCASLQAEMSEPVFSMSVDSFYAGTHFPAAADPFLIGYRVLNAAASDLAAMGARPLGFLLALGLSAEMRSQARLTELAAGLRLAALRTGLRLIGGNLAASDTTNLTITVIGGNQNKESLLRRGTARIGDSLFVSGHLGGAAAGLKFAHKSPREIDTREAALRAAYFCPQARLALGQQLVGVASSCMDLSDGLALDLNHLLVPAGQTKRSLGARVFMDALPLPQELVAGKDNPANRENLQLALTGGDDYELLFTAAPNEADRLARIGGNLGISISCIGEITEQPDIICCDEQGTESPMPVGGYKHF